VGITLRSAAEIEKLARVNALVARVLKELAESVRPGMTTKQLDELAEQRLVEAGAEPAFKGYHGYPATICASVNEAVVHGIGDRRRLQFGDLVKLDIGVRHKGFVGDVAMSIAVGGCPPIAPHSSRLKPHSARPRSPCPVDSRVPGRLQVSRGPSRCASAAGHPGRASANRRRPSR